MPDYKNGKVYKIVCNVTGMIYVGSTTQSLSMRMTGHRATYKHFKQGKCNNMTSFQIIEQGNCDIILIENVVCESKEELHRRERHFIESLVCVNKNIPTRTLKEYYEANKDVFLEKSKDYYKDNKDVLLEYSKAYREDNKDVILEYHKNYYEDNKDVVLEKAKVYYKDNKDVLLERNRAYREANRDKVLKQKKKYYEANKDVIQIKQKECRAKKKELEVLD
jgi:hypothetical protein